MSPSVRLHPRAAPHPLAAPYGATQPAAAPPAPPAGRRFAYVTLLTKDGYLPGVQALARSLRLVGGRYPMIVMYTKGVGQSALGALRDEGLHLQFTEQFEAEGVDHREYKRSLYLECWNKLRMWEMVEYDRLIYLDADMILLRSIDHLFELPHGFYAVGDCYGGRDEEEERNSCCHFRPDETPDYFNAGFYVMSPSLAELAEMKRALEEGRCPVRFFAEQDFLNAYFKGRWRHLPWAYNGQKRIKYHHPDLWSMDELFVIHYVDEKPWSHRYSADNLGYRAECDYWWDVFEGCLPPAAAQVPTRQLSTGLDRAGSLTPAGSLRGVATLAEALEGLELEPGTPTVAAADADAAHIPGLEGAEGQRGVVPVFAAANLAP
ncbi:glycosyl transferase isoform B [Micractinium conductrix]|uniref:Hexosyltransferase n=1 Tax=Micractinium conductrix TaxID=554055 RepID=A0A2P6VEZ1_9CHLO|nr:glycosyl transferase isoform A [Micractinium conductrix]PSC72666.1 glycosyl transferase isoform B [Micractinium conductrix]|eukprot:PSC72665.1 glycosyl transferase isoform A [Micractinium conductrix]